MNDNATLTTNTRHLATGDVQEGFGRFLRLHTADGDASPHTIRNYHTQAAQFVDWGQEHVMDPTEATEENIIAYRKHLVEAGYKRRTVALKLAAVRRLYEALVWRGLRQGNPAAGVKAPRDRTSRDERVKYLPLEDLKRLLTALQGDSAKAVRDRAILCLMGVHGLRVSEVAGLKVTDLDLPASAVRVLGKGWKTRTVYLTETTAAVLAEWLDVRGGVALPEACTVLWW